MDFLEPGITLKINKNEYGNLFVEAALLIILVVFAIAPAMSGLGNATAEKVGKMTTEISTVGSQ